MEANTAAPLKPTVLSLLLGLLILVLGGGLAGLAVALVGTPPPN